MRLRYPARRNRRRITFARDRFFRPRVELLEDRRLLSTLDDDTQPPLIEIFGSSGFETIAQEQYFEWYVSDDGPFHPAGGLGSVLVEIRQNGTLIHSSTDDVGFFDLDDHGAGEFVINVSATDADNDEPGESLTSTATQMVTVIDPDAGKPVITLTGSLDGETDRSVQSYSWNVTDDEGLNVVLVTITLDGEAAPIGQFSDASGSFNFDAYGLGLFEITVTALDTDGLSRTASRRTNVTDDDTLRPTIQLSKHPGQNKFLWAATDMSECFCSGLGPVSVEITQRTTQNETVIARPPYGDHLFDFSSFGEGVRHHSDRDRQRQ